MVYICDMCTYICIYIYTVFYPICWLVSLMLCHKPRRRLQHQCSPKSSFAPRHSEYNMPDRHSLVTNMHNYSGSAWLTFNRIRIPAPLTQNSSSWESSPTFRPAIGPWDMGCRELRLLWLSQLQRLRQLQKCYADVAAPLGPQNWNEDSFVSELVSLNFLVPIEAVFRGTPWSGLTTKTPIGKKVSEIFYGSWLAIPLFHLRRIHFFWWPQLEFSSFHTNWSFNMCEYLRLSVAKIRFIISLSLSPRRHLREFNRSSTNSWFSPMTVNYYIYMYLCIYIYMYTYMAT